MRKTKCAKTHTHTNIDYLCRSNQMFATNPIINVRNFVINLNDSIRALAIGQTHTRNLKSIICHSYSRNHIAYSYIQYPKWWFWFSYAYYVQWIRILLVSIKNIIVELSKQFPTIKQFQSQFSIFKFTHNIQITQITWFGRTSGNDTIYIHSYSYLEPPQMILFWYGIGQLRSEIVAAGMGWDQTKRLMELLMDVRCNYKLFYWFLINLLQ